MLRKAASLTIVLIASISAFSQNSQRLSQREYGAITEVVKAEMTAGASYKITRVCVDFAHVGVAPKDLVKYLRSQRLPVRNRRGCYPESSSQGLLLYVMDIHRDSAGQIKLDIEAQEMEYGADLATRLRRGIYALQQDEQRRWRVVAYTAEHPKSTGK